MKREQRNVNYKGIALGGCSSLLAALAMCALGALLIDRGVIGEMWLNYLAAGILVGASFLGAAVAGGTLEAVASACVFWILLLAVNAAAFDFELGGVGETMLAVIGGGAASALIYHTKSSTRKKWKKRRIVKLNKKQR